jgi:hypothetical protein
MRRELVIRPTCQSRILRNTTTLAIGEPQSAERNERGGRRGARDKSSKVAEGGPRPPHFDIFRRLNIETSSALDNLEVGDCEPGT